MPGQNKTLNTSSADFFGFAVQRTLNEGLKLYFSNERNSKQIKFRNHMFSDTSTERF